MVIPKKAVLIKTFEFELLRDAKQNVLCHIFIMPDQVDTNLCTLLAKQVYNGNRYWTSFVMLYEMINDMNFITSEVQLGIVDAVKKNRTL